MSETGTSAARRLDYYLPWEFVGWHSWYCDTGLLDAAKWNVNRYQLNLFRPLFLNRLEYHPAPRGSGAANPRDVGNNTP